MGYTRKGLIKLIISHHPSCNFYDNHVIKIPRLKNYPFCLGCSGFYPSMILALILSFFGILGKEWGFLVVISLFFFFPTVIRFFIVIPSKRKVLRFVSKIFLGLGVGIGFYSIIIAPNLIYSILQVLFGLVIYIGMAHQRSNDPYPECDPCQFNPSPVCPGMISFYDYELSLTLENN